MAGEHIAYRTMFGAFRQARHMTKLPEKPLAIDLFSGAGGITLGLQMAGFDVLACADISAACAQTHARNFPGVRFFHTDIGRLRSAGLLGALGLRCGELDLLIGGPPCQGFSILGRRETSDPRNALFDDFIRVAAALQPKVVVIENVPGLATLGGGFLLRHIGRAFEQAGYRVDCAELLAAQYGVPQMRWRMFFIAWRRDLGIPGGGFPAPTHGRRGIGDLVPNRTISTGDSAGFITVADAISDLPPIESGEIAQRYVGQPETAYQRAMRRGARSGELFNHYAPRLSEVNLERIRCLKPGQDWRSLPRHLLPSGMQRALRKDHTRRYRRMTWEGVARAIITRFRDPKSGEYIHPEQTRTISIREAARIQSFPDSFEFCGGYSEQYEQVGNAVPPLLAEAVAREIHKVLSGQQTQFQPIKSRYKIVA
jgi:DNA (cytosine-5)-methyltransferase 1